MSDYRIEHDIRPTGSLYFGKDIPSGPGYEVVTSVFAGDKRVTGVSRNVPITEDLFYDLMSAQVEQEELLMGMAITAATLTMPPYDFTIVG